MIVSGNWAAPLTALLAPLATECASGIPDPDDDSGGVGGLFPSGVEIAIGDEHLGKWQNASKGRIVLTMAGANGSAGLISHPLLEVLCATLPEYEAHLWVPTPRVAKVARFTLVSKLFTCLVRAVVLVHGGAQALARLNSFERWEPARDTELFRHGQDGIATFIVPTPITKGRFVQVLEGDARFGAAGEIGGGSLNVNPEE